MVRQIEALSKAVITIDEDSGRSMMPSDPSTNCHAVIPCWNCDVIVNEKLAGMGKPERTAPSLLFWKFQAPCADVGDDMKNSVGESSVTATTDPMGSGAMSNTT